MSDQPASPLPSNLWPIDGLGSIPGLFDHPNRIYIQLSQPPPHYEDFDLGSLTDGEPPPEECFGITLRRLYANSDLSTIPIDRQTMYYFDPRDDTQGEIIYPQLSKCLEIINSSSSNRSGMMLRSKFGGQLIKDLLKYYDTPMGIPHETYLGEHVQLAIAETIWDIAKLIKDAFNKDVDIPNPALEACRTLLPDKVAQYTAHASNAYGRMATICPEATPVPVTVIDDACNLQWARAIRRTADRLNPGDVLLLEGHFKLDESMNKLPLELDTRDDVFGAILYAVKEKGIVVIEPMGNGGKNLDHPIPGILSGLNTRDSGAILVAASQEGEQGVAKAFEGTNTGARADLHAPGASTALMDDNSPFGYTSAAAAIIAGMAVAAQSAYKARTCGKTLNSFQMRDYLKASGLVPAVSGIGVMPNLARFIEQVIDPLPPC